VKPTAQQKLARTTAMAMASACKVLANAMMGLWGNCVMCVDVPPTVLDTGSATTALANATKAGQEKIALLRCALLSATTTEVAPRMGNANVSLVMKALLVLQKHARLMI